MFARPALRRFSTHHLALSAAACVMLGACAAHPDAAPQSALDSGLNADLALAAQQQRATQVVSPQELMAAPTPLPAPVATAAPTRTRVIEHVIYRDRPTSYATSAPTPAPAPTPTYDPYPAPRREGTYDGGYGRGASGGYGSGTYGTGTYGTGTYGTAPRPVYRQPQGHAQRDGAVGAVAGAMIGVAASHRKDRLRGGLLGAVAGGALGALYGHSVDRTP